MLVAGVLHLDHAVTLRALAPGSHRLGLYAFCRVFQISLLPARENLQRGGGLWMGLLDWGYLHVGAATRSLPSPSSPSRG
jgi:hypothetical protein